MSTAREEAERIMDALPKHPWFPLVSWRHSDSGLRHRDAIEAALTAAHRRGLEDAAKVAESHHRDNALRYIADNIASAIRALAGEEGT